MAQERIESILNATKRACGLVETYHAFDSEILLHINAAFSVLHQLGAGPKDGFTVEDESTEWSQFMDDGPILNLVRQYIPMSVHHDWDPPTNGTVLKSMEQRISQLESRISYYVDPSNDNSFFEENEETEEEAAVYSNPFAD